MQAIAPHVERLAAAQGKTCVFLKVDVDHARDIAESCGIRAMPTFHFYLREQLVEEFSGANLARLEEAIKRFAPNTCAFEGEGQRLGDSSTMSAPLLVAPTAASPAVKASSGPIRSNPTTQTNHTTTTVIQLRFPDHSTEEGHFKPTDTLKEVALFLLERRPQLGVFSLLQMYPKKLYKPSEFESVNLSSSGLHPRGALSVVL